MKNTTNTVSLESYVDKLLEEKAMTDLDGEVLAQLKKDLLDRVEDHINAAMLAALPPEKLGEFEKVLDTGSETDIQAYCSNNISNLDEVVAQTLIRFRATYLG